MRRIALFGLAALSLAAGPARADCTSDCNAQYEAAMAACQQANPDPSQVDPLQSCMDQAQEAYGKCIESCQASSN